MPETRRSPYADALSRVVVDLWGEQTTPPKAASAKTTPPAETFPPFERLWIAADETVEWTEALVRDTCPDGMTDAATWRFLHELASRVLAGEPEAYRAAIERMKPTDDLLPYVRHAQVTVEDADRLTAVFDASPAYLNGNAAEDRRYLAGMALRFARDLLALLPALSVTITAQTEGHTALQVTFTRSFLRSLRFGAIDPVQTVQAAGGTFNDPAEM